MSDEETTAETARPSDTQARQEAPSPTEGKSARRLTKAERRARRQAKAERLTQRQAKADKQREREAKAARQLAEREAEAARRREEREAKTLKRRRPDVEAKKPKRRGARPDVSSRPPSLLRTTEGASPIPALRAEWLVPVRAPLLLISQIERSGGTLLNRLFDDHPACLTHPYELAWGGRASWDWPALDLEAPPEELLDRLHEAWLTHLVKWGFYSKGPSRRAPSAGEPNPFIFDTALQALIFRTCVEERQPTRQRDVLDDYLTSLFNAWMDYQNLYRGPKRFVTAFMPRLIMHPEHVAGFLRDYPDGHLVSIVREPASWFASVGRAQPDLFGDLDVSMALWSASAAATLKLHTEHPQRMTGVLFEDLVSQPEGVMRRLCERTGLVFRNSLLVPTFNARPVASNSSFVPTEEIDQSAVDRAGHLPSEDVARIRETTRHVHDAARARFGL